MKSRRTAGAGLAMGLAFVALAIAVLAVTPRFSLAFRPAAPVAIAAEVGLTRLGAAALAQEAAGTPATAATTGEASGTLRETLIQAVLEGLPPPPAFVRLVRISLEPGASVPLHTHPGPEFGWVESGTLTVRAEGEVVVAPASTGGETRPALVPPVGEEFSLQRGDQVVYPAAVPFTFVNAGPEVATVLTAVILPAGDGSPPGSSWVDGTPGPEAMAGVRSQILGDAVVAGWPRPPLAMVVDRVALGPGETIPARPGPVLLSVELGRFGFQLMEGQFQVSRGESGPLPNATPGASYSLGPGDAVFFPGGMTEVPRPDADGVLVLLRLSVLSAATDAGTAATPSAAAGAATPAPVETTAPAATAEPTTLATAPPGTAAPAAGSTDGGAVVVTASGVRLRDAPSTSAGVVSELDEGRALEIAGPAVEGDGIVWYPVRAIDDPAVAGFIAEAFIAPAS